MKITFDVVEENENSAPSGCGTNGHIGELRGIMRRLYVIDALTARASADRKAMWFRVFRRKKVESKLEL